MKLQPFLCVPVFAFLFISCSKDSIEWNVKKTMTIDEDSHAFVTEDGKRYLEGTLGSQKESHVYKLDMIKDIYYRISATQPEALINNLKMTLVNSSGDTLAESQNSLNAKSFIVVKSPQTKSYYVILGLLPRTNPKFDYRIYFEEVIDEPISLSGLDWHTNVIWNLTQNNAVEMTNSDSRVYRYLQLVNPVEGYPNVSFVIQSDSRSSPNFGLILDASDNLMQFSEFAYELANIGWAFVASKKDNNYVIMRFTEGQISYSWSPLPSIFLNFPAGVRVELKSEANLYGIYLNGTRLQSIGGSLNGFYILTEDRGDGITQIKDIQIGI